MATPIFVAWAQCNNAVIGQSFVVGVAVPDVEVVKAWARENDMHGTLSVLCGDSRVKHAILDDLHEHGKLHGLKSFEQVSRSVFIADC